MMVTTLKVTTVTTIVIKVITEVKTTMSQISTIIKLLRQKQNNGEDPTSMQVTTNKSIKDIE